MKEYIKQKAKERNISLQAIADKLGLKSYPSFLRTIETGENLKAKQLKTIADMLCFVGIAVQDGGSVGGPAAFGFPVALTAANRLPFIHAVR